ncbi:unnamed protein product [Haemonchus placei]|uniref:deoxyribose-phosphate aldolase n=1 Tax=Haemonchus placei TaxID=6290 RepID=A0A0N4W6Z3_HAEPC|nr:unnamed protein product [Haemonchus placei]
MGVFDRALFEKETSRTFDPKEIASATARYEKEGAELSKQVKLFCMIDLSTLQKEQVRKVVSYIDLTTLAGDDTKSRVEKLVDRALSPIPGDPSVTCAAVCVYPQRVHNVASHLKDIKKKFNVAAVAAGFPSGQYHLKSKLLEVQLTVADGANEIDIVISRAAALEGEWESSDFIKTSTGKETTNATLEVSFVMCSAIKRWYELTGKKVGFKPAGGIKTPLEALAYVALVKNVRSLFLLLTR